MNQELFNIIAGVAGALGGWWLKVMHESLKDLTMLEFNNETAGVIRLA